MDNSNNHLVRLLKKDSWSREEKKWLLGYLETTNGKELQELLTQQFGEIDTSAPPDDETSRLLLEKMHERMALDLPAKKAPVIPIRKWRVVAAASVMGLLILAAFYLAFHNNKKEVVQKQAPAKQYKNDVLPGSNKAILILADGSKINLDDTRNGLVTTQGNSSIIKTGNRLAYDNHGATAKHVVYNTITTPRAAQYQVELPDGSVVWLNAASSLRFPTTFTGNERRVEVNGELYFEVIKDKTKPFIVAVSGAEITVLGTHFNVMAYSDEEAFQTTLLEGKVKVVKRDPDNYREANGKPVIDNPPFAILKPGEQASLSHTSRSSHPITVQKVDVDRVTAWKNGMFDFENADIETVMRQVSRWYDVEVIFKTHHNNDLFILEMPRSSKLSDVLKILALTGNIKFEIDGKKVLVYS